MPMKFAETFKPTWQKIFASLVLAYVLGKFVGTTLYLLSACSELVSIFCGKPYAPVLLVIAYALSWPFLLLNSMFWGVQSYSLFAVGFFLTWLYYYVLACPLPLTKRVNSVR